MRAVIQRVSAASVTLNHRLVASITKGLVILLGVEKQDSSLEAQRLAKRVSQLRIFNNQDGKMGLSAQEVEAQMLVVSQFTLCADLLKGRRPSFEGAAPAELAEKLYLEFIQHLENAQLKVERGIFKEYMTVHIHNDGPVTFILDK